MWPCSNGFDPARDLSDLTGKVALVSGATGGIGFHVAEHLALQGCKVFVGARTDKKGRDTISRIETEHPKLKGLVDWFQLDISTIAGTKACAERFLERERRLDILVNNAGVMNSRYSIGFEGIEASMATNHFGPFVLTTTLLPLLTKTAEEANSDVRIVTVGSQAMMVAPSNARFGSLQDFNNVCASNYVEGDTWFNRQKRYALTKVTNTIFTNELQRRLSSSSSPSTRSIICTSLHPGLVASPGASTVLPPVLRFVHYGIKSPRQGAYTVLFAAASPVVRRDGEKYKGAYLEPYTTIKKPPSALARDDELAKELWTASEEIVRDVLAKA